MLTAIAIIAVGTLGVGGYVIYRKVKNAASAATSAVKKL